MNAWSNFSNNIRINALDDLNILSEYVTQINNIITNSTTTTNIFFNYDEQLYESLDSTEVSVNPEQSLMSSNLLNQPDLNDKFLQNQIKNICNNNKTTNNEKLNFIKNHIIDYNEKMKQLHENEITLPSNISSNQANSINN